MMKTWTILFSLLFVSATALAGRAPAVVSNPQMSKSAIEGLAAKKSLGAFMAAVQLGFKNPNDVNFLKSEFKKLKLHRHYRQQINIKSKMEFEFKSMGRFLVRMNGKELTHQGRAFRLNPNYSFQKNVEQFSKTLATVSQSPWFLEAHADEGEIQVFRIRALWVASALSYMGMAEQDRKSIDELVDEPTMASLLTLDQSMEINDLTCLRGGDATQPPQEIVLKFKNGSQLNIHPAKNEILTSVNVNGQFRMEADPYYSQLFNQLSGSACSFTDDDYGRSAKKYMIARTNEVMRRLNEAASNESGTGGGSIQQ